MLTCSAYSYYILCILQGSQLPLAAVVGIAIGATITAVSLSLTVALLICFCCCCVQSKKYEYNTGNEHR